MSYRINSFIRLLVFSDFFVAAAVGFLGPVLPIFIANRIPGGDVKTAGFATAIYTFVWILQIPIGRFLDRTVGDRDDLLFLVVGSFITALSYFFLTVASLPWHIYLIQAFAGLGRAIDLPAWYALFTRGIDKSREGYEWSIENVSFALSLGVGSALSGIITEAYGFRVLFFVAASVALVAAFVLLFLYRAAVKRGEKPW